MHRSPALDDLMTEPSGKVGVGGGVGGRRGVTSHTTSMRTSHIASSSVPDCELLSEKETSGFNLIDGDQHPTSSSSYIHLLASR